MPSRGSDQRVNEDGYVPYSLISPRVGHRTTIGHVPRRTSPQPPKATAPSASPRFSPRSTAPPCLGAQRHLQAAMVQSSAQGRTGTPLSPSPVRRTTGLRVTSPSLGERRQATASPTPMTPGRLPSERSAPAQLGTAMSWMPKTPGAVNREGSRGQGLVQVQPARPSSVQTIVVGPARGSCSRGHSVSSSDDRDGGCWIHREGGFKRAMHEAMRVRPPSPGGLAWVNDTETTESSLQSKELTAERLFTQLAQPRAPGTPQISGSPRTSGTPQVSGTPRNPPATPPFQTRLGGGSLKLRAPECPGGSLKLRSPERAESNASGEVCWELQGPCKRTPVLDTRMLVQPPSRVAPPASRLDTRRSTGNTSRSTSRETRLPSRARSSSNSSRASSVRGTSRPGSLTTPHTSAEPCWELQANWRTQRHSAPASQVKPRVNTPQSSPRVSTPQSSRPSSRPSTPSVRTRSNSPGQRAASVGTTLRLSGQPRQPRQGTASNQGTVVKRESGKLVSPTGSGTTRSPKADEQEELPPYAEGVIQQVQRIGATKTQSSTNHAKPRNTSRSVSPSNEVAELQLGTKLKIEDCTCEITDALGMGSFGTVWAATDLITGDTLAVKEIACWTHNELMNALFERHLLRVLSTGPVQGDGLNTPPAQTQSQSGSAPGSASTASNRFGTCDFAKIPSLVGHEVLCLKPKRVRLAMTRVPGIALEDFLEDRRCAAATACAAGIAVSPQERFNEACNFTHKLLTQLAPIFEQISAVAIHRDVNTHNILIDTAKAGEPRYGLVDFGLAVDTQCWCSTENNPETKWRPTRIGLDAVHTWRYLDIAGDCRYWPVSAWTQFLIGWKEIDACQSLRTEYKVQLDQHALGITAMKVFVELLSPPPPKEHRSSEGGRAIGGDSLESSGIPNVQMEIWTLLRAWERYWKRITPVHKKLISTFHNGGDWDVLKQMCEDTNFYENIAKDLRKMREAVADAAEACRQVAVKHEQGFDEPAAAEDAPVFPKAAKIFQALLLLISDGKTPDMLNGPDAWQAVSRTLVQGADQGGAFFDSHELPTASACSSTASTAEAPPGRQSELQAQKLATNLPS